MNQTPELVYDPATDTTETRPRAEARAFGVEFRRDIYPVLDRECRSCHSAPDGVAPASGGRVAIFDPALSGFDAEVRAYRALAHDSDNTYAPGQVPTAGNPAWYLPQVSRYVRIPQARASLLVWKVYGERLDGRTNEDLPADGDMRGEDVDYEVGSCPAPDLLTADEKRAIARWVDLGAPLDLDRPVMTYSEDHAVPVLTVEAYELSDMMVGLRVGLLDTESGIDPASFHAELTLPDGTARSVAYDELDYDAVHRLGSLDLGVASSEVTVETPLLVLAEVRDRDGNLERVRRTISRLGPPPPPIPPAPDGGTSDADGGTGGGDEMDSGCGCHAVGASRLRLVPTALLALPALVLARRRRRARGSAWSAPS
ncbi:MAG: hypothetical protein R3B82_09645 [Sandaracinaceae bacterium]